MTNLRALVEDLMKLPPPLRGAVLVLLHSGVVTFTGEAPLISSDSTTASALTVKVEAP